MSFALIAIVTCVFCITVGNCETIGDDTELAIHYLMKYGYLNNSTHAISTKDAKQVLHDAIALFQEYYRLPGKGNLNNITLEYMRKPRCGLQDLSYHTSIKSLTDIWPKKHLTWNFHLASEKVLKTTQAAFDLWAANSSLTFERDTQHPDILISFREGLHMLRNGDMCPHILDGPGGVLAHASFPNGDSNYVSEIHVDKTEPWHIFVSKNPSQKYSLLYTLAHEIGHSLGLEHSELKDSIMYALASENPDFPILLSLEDILQIQQLYGANNDIEDYSKTTNMIPTTTTVTSIDNVPIDPCVLQNVDSILIINKRIYIAYEQYIWPIDINGKTYDKPLRLTDFMHFLPANFTRLSAAYQKPSGELVLFINNLIYMVTYPGYELIQGWPKNYGEFGIASNAQINAALNTNKGQSFVIYNGHVVGEIDDCKMKVVKHHNLQSIFPGIPYGISSGFRYIDGNLYFINKQQFYIFNEFTETVTTAGKFDLEIIGVICPRDGLLQQLRDLLSRLVNISINSKKE